MCFHDLTEESDDEELNIEYVEDLDEEDEVDLEQDMEGAIIIYSLLSKYDDVPDSIAIDFMYLSIRQTFVYKWL